MKKKYEEEYYKIVSLIIKNPEFQRRKNFKHHGEESVYDHSIKVSYLAYKMARKLHVNSESAAIGGLLHDFYTKPWMDAERPKKVKEMHGFAHAKDAYKNAEKEFSHMMTPKIKDTIVKHMFPLNIRPPRYVESWLVSLADKLVSLKVFLSPRDLPMYIGIKKRKK